MSSVAFACDLAIPGLPFPHCWEHTVASLRVTVIDTNQVPRDERAAHVSAGTEQSEPDYFETQHAEVDRPTRAVDVLELIAFWGDLLARSPTRDWRIEADWEQGGSTGADLMP